MGTSETNLRNYRSKTALKVEFLVKPCNDLEISFEWLFNDIGERKKPDVTVEHIPANDSASILISILISILLSDLIYCCFCCYTHKNLKNKNHAYCSLKSVFISCYE